MKPSTPLLAGIAFALLPALALSIPGAAGATTIELNNPTATFSQPTGGTNITYPSAHEIRWGIPAQGQQSGLGFDVFNSPLNINTDTAFNLGTLHHFNFPVNSGTAISGVNLTFAFDIPGASISPLSFLFNLGVDETPNAPPCAVTPVPSTNYCPDIISFPQMGGSTTFTLNGVLYTLNLLGFGTDANDLANNFVTQEGKDNFTSLWASISAPVAQVPEPGSLLTMALGLFGLVGLTGWRRKLKADR